MNSPPSSMITGLPSATYAWRALCGATSSTGQPDLLQMQQDVPDGAPRTAPGAGRRSLPSLGLRLTITTTRPLADQAAWTLTIGSVGPGHGTYGQLG